jgi:hypothetical protein
LNEVVAPGIIVNDSPLRNTIVIGASKNEDWSAGAGSSGRVRCLRNQNLPRSRTLVKAPIWWNRVTVSRSALGASWGFLRRSRESKPGWQAPAARGRQSPEGASSKRRGPARPIRLPHASDGLRERYGTAATGWGDLADVHRPRVTPASPDGSAVRQAPHSSDRSVAQPAMIRGARCSGFHMRHPRLRCRHGTTKLRAPARVSRIDPARCCLARAWRI